MGGGEAPGGRPATILLVDEAPAGRQRLAALLRERGHRVLEASRGDETAARIRAEAPDLVLIDLLIPDADVGLLVLALRQDRDFVQPRILLRAGAQFEAEARALAGVVGVPLIPQELRPEALLAGVDALLAEPRPAPGEPVAGPREIDLLMRPVMRKLCRHVANLERSNAEIEGLLVNCRRRLQSARLAVDHEAMKRRRAEHELSRVGAVLREQSVRDELTGLYTRRYMEESLGRAESDARRRGESLCLMAIAVDGFARYHDTLGHAAGDAVLRAVGQLIGSLARHEDVVCRLGGDEFALVAGRMSASAAVGYGERLRDRARELVLDFDGGSIRDLTLSIGIGVFPEHGASCRAVLQVADAALRAARQAGRNRVVLGPPVPDRGRPAQAFAAPDGARPPWRADRDRIALPLAR